MPFSKCISNYRSELEAETSGGQNQSKQILSVLISCHEYFTLEIRMSGGILEGPEFFQAGCITSSICIFCK